MFKLQSSYALTANLAFSDQVKSPADIKNYAKSFEAKQDEIKKTVPPGFDADIKASNVEIQGSFKILEFLSKIYLYYSFSLFYFQVTNNQKDAADPKEDSS